MNIKYIPYSDKYFEKIIPLVCGSIDVLNKRDYDDAMLDIMKSWQTPERLTKKFSEGEYFIALSGDDVVGIGGLVGNEVCTMFVDPHYVGQGIGKRILLMIEDKAKELQIKMICLSSTLTAKGFYEKSGFSVKERAIHKLDGNDFEVFVMEKEL
jgi:N-acetylglutamate synthase-like GNAT family acetyltransferase